MEMWTERIAFSLANQTKQDRIKFLTRIYPKRAKETETDCRTVIKYYDEVVEGQYWKEVADSEEEYFSKYYGKPKEWFEVIRTRLLNLPSSQSLTIGDLRREEAVAQATNPLPKKRRGGVRKIDPAEVYRLKEEGKTNREIADELRCSDRWVRQILNQRGSECYHDNIHFHPPDSPDDRGTNTAYLASSIAAKSPETLIAMQQGKYPSVRAAAIDAGVVKARKTFSVGPTTDPQDFALRLKEGLSDEFLAKLTAALNELVLSNLE
jgi:hypothetical protein